MIATLLVWGVGQGGFFVNQIPPALENSKKASANVI